MLISTTTRSAGSPVVQRSFGTVTTSVSTESICFHSVCLCCNPGEWDATDPVRGGQLKETSDALKAAVPGLGKAKASV